MAMVPPAVAAVPWKTDESSPASCQSASCPSQGDLPQSATAPLAFLRALHALVVLPQCYRGTDPLGSRTLGAFRRWSAAGPAHAGGFAGVGACDAPSGTGGAHHARAQTAAAADAAFDSCG